VNGAEPWRLPDIETLPKMEIQHDPGTAGTFRPYLRDPETLVRPWVVPGTPGKEHRIGGLEKADITGFVSYDPDNHEKMVRLRAEKVERIARDIPALEVEGPRQGDLLVLGWGSTYGAISSACRDLRSEGVEVSNAQLRYIHPLPANVGNVLSRFKLILVPELNMGQMRMLLASRFKAEFVGLNKIQGQPFKIREIRAKIEELMEAGIPVAS